MTGQDERSLGDRMKQLEKTQAAMASDIGDIKTALLGNVLDGTTGLVGRIRDRERVAENHDLRIVRLETERKYYVEKKDFEALEEEVEANTEWRQRVMYMIAGAAAAGAITGGGVVAFVMRLVGGP